MGAKAKRPTRENKDPQAKLNAVGFGFKSRKRAALLDPAQLVSKPLEPRAKGQKAEEQKPLVVEEKPLPFHTHAVQVDPFVKRAYRVIDSKSYLVWGLTSDWAVEDGARRSRRAAAAITSSSSSSAPATSVAPAADDSRDDASEGYGEMTAGSIQRVLNTMQQLHEHAAPGVLPERKSGGGWELTATSSFVDIGSGYGKVVVHAGVGLPGVRAHGIEYVASRAQVAEAALAQLRGQSAAAALALSGVSLVCGDATVDLGSSIAFSHVYIYDKVFADTTIERLASLLNQSKQVKVLAVYQRPETWWRLGLADRFVVAASLTMNTTGNQSFRCHLLVQL